MDRFFGMMPIDKIEKEVTYKDDLGMKITIQAGPHGYTIIFMDNTTEYEDIDDTTENNFNKAYNIALGYMGTLIEVQ